MKDEGNQQTQLFQINQSEESGKITINAHTTIGQLHQHLITPAVHYNRIYSTCGRSITLKTRFIGWLARPTQARARTRATHFNVGHIAAGEAGAGARTHNTLNTSTPCLSYRVFHVSTTMEGLNGEQAFKRQKKIV